MKKIIFSIAFLLIFIGLTRAEQLRIAIMDLQSGSGVPEYFGADIAELIRTEMINLKKYIVLERSQMKEVLKEQEFQLSGCTETESSKGGFRLKTASYIVTGLAIIPGIGWAKVNNDLKKLYEDYKSLSPDQTLSWDENRWDDEWQKIEDKKKTRNALASLTILTAGIGITMFLVDAIFLKPKTSSQALNDFEKNFLICSDYNKISIYYIKRF